MAQRISLTDLTDALQGRDREKVARDMRETLASLQARTDRNLSGGTKPVEFERQQKIGAAISCAIAVFDAYIAQ
jgi:predicted metal-dependent peptidase